MEKKTTGIVVAAAKMWWLKINTKPVRLHSLDGAVFPHVIKVRYSVGEKSYFKRKWIGAGKPVPGIGSEILVSYREDAPGKAKIL